MKIKSLILAVAAAVLLAGVALVSQQTESTAPKMASAAQKFLGSLTAEQSAKTVFDFGSKERTNWFFIPKQDKNRKTTRKGLGFVDMTAEQKKLAIGLLASGTSKSGKTKAVAIMALEGVLHELESKRKRQGSVRNPEWYFISVFGKPGNKGKWGWRLEGHHLSLNYTIHDGNVVSTTPAFFGANPALLKKNQIPKGNPAVALPDAERLAMQLFRSLDKEQKQAALQKKHFGETQQGAARVKVGEPVGISASKMNKKQRKMLARLLQSYTSRMPADVARAQLRQVDSAGDNIHFAWTGAAKKGSPHTYRIHGGTFVVEFLNTQPSPDGVAANHIHSSWRNIDGDFGIGAD